MEELTAVVGGDHVVTDVALRSSFETDWTRRFSGRALAVVRPASTAEVREVMQVCTSRKVAVRVQGGNTGLVGGATPLDGEIVLWLGRLRQLVPPVPGASQVTVGAGMTLVELQKHAQAAGMEFGLDLASRDSATIGGLIATNAGGLRVLRHGSMRQQVIGLEVVLADGSCLSRLEPLPKDATGYDLLALVPGSEGTLAIVTAATLRLTQALPRTAVALLGFDTLADAVGIVPAARAELSDLSSVELFLRPGLEMVLKHTAMVPPLSSACEAYVLIECAALEDPIPELEHFLAGAKALKDATIGSDPATKRALWAYRERHTEAIAVSGPVLKLDVALPHHHLVEFVENAATLVANLAETAQVVTFGHLAEGNLHINILNVENQTSEVSDAVLRLVARYQGSISAEHGVGRAKAPWLPLTRSRREVEVMLAVKKAMDPQALLNRGVLFG